MKQTFYKHPMPVCDHVRNRLEDAVPRVGRVFGTGSSRAVTLTVVLAQAHEEAGEEF